MLTFLAFFDAGCSLALSNPCNNRLAQVELCRILEGHAFAEHALITMRCVAVGAQALLPVRSARRPLTTLPPAPASSLPIVIMIASPPRCCVVRTPVGASYRQWSLIRPSSRSSH